MLVRDVALLAGVACAGAGLIVGGAVSSTASETSASAVQGEPRLIEIVSPPSTSPAPTFSASANVQTPSPVAPSSPLSSVVDVPPVVRSTPSGSSPKRSSEKQKETSRPTVEPVSGCPAGPVYLVGDSLTDPDQGAAGKYAPTLFKQKKLPLSLYGAGGLSVRAILNEKYSATIGSSDARDARTWIVAMGTNDSEYGFSDKTRAVMRKAGDRDVYWVNIARPDSSNPGPDDGVNTALRKAEKQYPNLHLIDYAAAIQQESHYLSGDGMHLAGSSAYKWRARLYLSPWKKCL